MDSIEYVADRVAVCARAASDVSASRPLLSVADLSVSFRRQGLWRPVVRDVAFEVGPRETVAVVGESGSGKSVTALSIMRLVPTANGRVQGSIKLEGRQLLTLPDAEMQQVRGNEISMIFRSR